MYDSFDIILFFFYPFEPILGHVVLGCVCLYLLICITPHTRRLRHMRTPVLPEYPIYWMLIFAACNPILAGVSSSPPRPLFQAARLFTGPLGSLGLDDVANKVKRIYETRMRDHTEEL